MNSDLFLEIIKHFTKQYNDTHPKLNFLLLLDNLVAHLGSDASSWAKAHNLDMLYFPPHTSHFLQPLDQTFFSRFKQLLGWTLQNLSLLPGGPDVWRDKSLTVIEKALQDASTPANIKATWERAGSCLFEADKLMDLWKSDVFGRLLLELDKDCLEHTVSLCNEVIESKLSMQQTWKGSSKVRKGRFAANTVLDCDATTEQDKP